MTYSGIFVRDQLGQIPGQVSSAFSTSPDTILYGTAIAPDTSIFTTSKGYEDAFGSTVYINQDNYVYLRGKNANSGAQLSNMFFYYTQSDLMLWPKNWQKDQVTVNGTAQNWSPLSASAAGDVAVTKAPFVWVPPPLHGSQWDHYCVISWADNKAPDAPTPPDLATLGQMSSTDQLAAFVSSQHNMGWRNTADVYGSPPSYTAKSGLSFAEGGGAITVSIKFLDIPLDGTFNVNLQGTEPSNSIAVSGAKLSDNQHGFNTNVMNFPGDFSTSLAVEWFKGATTPPITARVVVTVQQLMGPLLFKEMAKVGIGVDEIPFSLYQSNYKTDGCLPSSEINTPTPVVLLGEQTWNLKYGQSA